MDVQPYNKDTPLDFVNSIISADKHYLESTDTDVLIGNSKLFDYLRVPEFISKLIIEPANILIHASFSKTVEQTDKNLREILIKAYNNEEVCAHDEITYQALNYLAVNEGPWAVNLINSTFLKDYVKIPDGTKEFLKKLSTIERCKPK